MSLIPDIKFINETNEKDKSRLWCEVCEIILSTAEDNYNIKENGCCEECWLTFGQMRQKEWKEGWRPDSEILNRYKQSRRIINIDIMQILGE
jgi:hypothetical protein